MEDYNSIKWDEIFYYSESSPTFLRYRRENETSNKANKRFAGDIAGSISDRYSTVKFNNKSWMVHRIIWILHNGHIDHSLVINHIDFNKQNNNIENLELCSFRQNLCRTKIRNKLALHHKNKSGINGVSRCVKFNGYKVYEYFNVQWVDENKKKRHKLFSIEKLTEEIALQMAIEFRYQVEIHLKTKGLG